MYCLIFYVPAGQLEEVKTAVFAAGAGRIGDYEHCCWQTAGQGQYRPLEGSNPFIGETHRLETVAEYKVELVCRDDCLQAVLAALLAAHPYEEPAYAFWPVNRLPG